MNGAALLAACTRSSIGKVWIAVDRDQEVQRRDRDIVGQRGGNMLLHRPGALVERALASSTGFQAASHLLSILLYFRAVR